VVSTLPRLLDSLEDAGLPHGFEEVDYACATDGFASPLVYLVPDLAGVEALWALPKDP
jgi:hypothetical protein